jgi:deoxyribodipyrimidine photo-lyase
MKKGPSLEGPVLYWMSRDQRVHDNWALSYAIEVAENKDQPVMVVFNLSVPFFGATWRQYDFMLKGLMKTELLLHALNIPFTVLIGNPETSIPAYVIANKISHLIMDFDPLKIKREWQHQVIEHINISADIVDAHNIVPCVWVSEKEEFAAYTFRPRIKRHLEEFLDDFPPLINQQGKFKLQRIQWEAISGALKVDHSVKPVEWMIPGEKGARIVLDKFIEKKIGHYAAKRNDPNEKHTSGLSPYLHFGNISAQRVALELLTHKMRDENTDAFLEELIIRKELADNFCYYNPAYDSVAGFKDWARITLNDHEMDERAYIYSKDEFELAQTHDGLWNAAQTQMLQTGAMHGYMRMYWAKKILEWTENPAKALEIAIYLNDKYMLDGRDPGGYTGCAWSIGGVHDRAWSNRPVYGKIRYMNSAGCERKFDVEQYITRVKQRKAY